MICEHRVCVPAAVYFTITADHRLTREELAVAAGNLICDDGFPVANLPEGAAYVAYEPDGRLDVQLEDVGESEGGASSR